MREKVERQSGAFLLNELLDPPFLDDRFSNRRNKPGMSMKTKEGCGKFVDLGRAVEAFFLRIGRSASHATDPSPGPRRLMKTLSRSTLSPGREQVGFEATLKIEGTNRECL
jgi:hypothetical protein